MEHKQGNPWPLLNTNADSSSKMNASDPLILHGSDNPGMMLVSHQLTGNNFLPWRKSMIIALGAKNKLGFVTGEVPKPSFDDESYADWRKIDWMVLSWILNSLSKEIAETFISAESSKELWEEIGQRYGENNGPLKYKLQREINTLTQGNNTAMEYFGKLKKLWDELACVGPVQSCNCEKGKLAAQHEHDTKLIQFFMGLNDSYENLKGQIMMMEPLPTINKAYSMVLSAERQRNVQNLYGETGAMMART
ncbi:Unknown protein [Striga hermonthica]|uniref:Retrotransposon Copia-like N-terminal domain-containing protein n=1 Tax=Striga hermonthica TaxID=68872 RepID=A0A9N7RTT0_STRHE|nr:Unknown protein [Striga hermonthica]